MANLVNLDWDLLLLKKITNPSSLENSFTENKIWRSVFSLASEMFLDLTVSLSSPSNIIGKPWNLIFFKCLTTSAKRIVVLWTLLHIKSNIHSTNPEKKNIIESAKDLRPINLLNSTYKVITKCLASRLNPIINNILDSTQSTFFTGRNKMDCFVVAEETLHYIHDSWIQRVIVKLDSKKTFDNISWDFLLNALEGFGFGQKWNSWIKACITTARFSILINGTSKYYFTSWNGLRQSDPLSSLLFIIVTHILNKMLTLGQQNNLIQGIKFPNQGSNILNI